MIHVIHVFDVAVILRLPALGEGGKFSVKNLSKDDSKSLQGESEYNHQHAKLCYFFPCRLFNLPLLTRFFLFAYVRRVCIKPWMNMFLWRMPEKQYDANRI